MAGGGYNKNGGGKSVPGTGQGKGPSDKPGGRTSSSNRNPKYQDPHGMKGDKKNNGK